MRAEVYHLLRFLRSGWKNLWLRKLRSFLTVLGIVFGVASVIAMLAIGEGASFEARERIRQMGSNNIIVRAMKPPSESNAGQVTLSVYGMTPLDRRRIEAIPSVERVAATWESSEEIRYLDHSVTGRLVAVEPDYADVALLGLQEGRFLHAADARERRPVAVIGSSVRLRLFPSENPVGRSIRVRSSYFVVVGVAESRTVSGDSPGGGLAEDINFDVYVPLETARSFFGEYVVKGTGGLMRREREWVRFHRLIAKVRDSEKVVNSSLLIRNILALSHKKVDYEILVPLQLLQQAEHTRRIFNIVLGSIAAISLLVGGIGIMNIMLATVTERTREIGIRRALGARRKDIIQQFLIESIILSASGGVIGVVLGVIIPGVVTRLSGMKTLLPFWAVSVAFSTSVFVGIVFGIYPARRAAFLDPIEALRHE